MIITLMIGSESHTTNWAKGFVFVVNGEIEEHIYKSSKARLVRKDPPHLIGTKGRHGSWTRYQFDIPEGTVLKLFTQSNNENVSAYFKVSASAPLIRAYGAIAHGNGAEVEGQIEWISPTEFDVDPKYIAAFDKGGLSLTELISA
jgi:hypothetical protein